MSNNKLAVLSSPHFRSRTNTQNIMLDVLIALLPTLVASIAIFGIRALYLTLVCVLSCMAFEWLYRKGMKLQNTVGDLSAAVTGILLAFNLPVRMPFWMAVIGCFVAIVVVKQLFGGMGQNFANPAITARIVLLVSFATPMTSWAAPLIGPEATAGATPLMMVGEDVLPAYSSLFMGLIGGSLGETCKLTLLLGGLYLIVRKVITATIPLTIFGTVAVLSLLLGRDPLYQLLTGGLILGALFMATDYVTSPTTEKGKFFFGLGVGILTIVIRFYAGYPEGISFAILLMNIVAPHIDRMCNRKAFGGVEQ